jgi:hypothetical protein
MLFWAFFREFNSLILLLLLLLLPLLLILLLLGVMGRRRRSARLFACIQIQVGRQVGWDHEHHGLHHQNE